jgi:carbon-monoxide dehydrogenase small subunit
MAMTRIALNVNGSPHAVDVEPRRHLADVLREELGLRGTHLGCEHGVCGACTVLFDGEPVRSCLMLAIQADGHEITTVEGLSQDGELHPLQQAFRDHHALQCGFCTPGFLMTAHFLLSEQPDLAEKDEEEIRVALAGNICRCTGYHNIVDAVRDAAERVRHG